MEFLRETQRYIDFIRKPISGEDEILGIDKQQGIRKRSASVAHLPTPRPKTMGPSPTARDAFHTPTNHHLTITFSRQTSQPSSPARERSPPESRERMKRVLSLPMCVVEAGFGINPESQGKEEILMQANIHPRALVPKSKKSHRPPHQRLRSMQIEQFLSRFDQRPEPDLATPVTRGLVGWKLTTGSKSARALTPPDQQSVSRKLVGGSRCKSRPESICTPAAHAEERWV